MSKCLYNLDPPFFAFDLEQFCFFHGLVALFWGPLDVFFEFHLFLESFIASLEKLATTVLTLHCGICLSASAFMAFLNVFSML